jgi:hypothetical protein
MDRSNFLSRQNYRQIYSKNEEFNLEQLGRVLEINIPLPQFYLKTGANGRD